MSLYLEGSCNGPCEPCHDCDFYGYQTATTCPVGQKPVITAVTDTPSGITIECTDCKPVSCSDLKGGGWKTCTQDDTQIQVFVPVSFSGYNRPLSTEECLALVALANEAVAPCDTIIYALDSPESEDYYGLTCYFCNVFNDSDI